MQGRPLLPNELDLFKTALGIGPHNFWRWSSRTRNFKLLTDGKVVWVEGTVENIGKTIPSLSSMSSPPSRMVLKTSDYTDRYFVVLKALGIEEKEDSSERQWEGSGV